MKKNIAQPRLGVVFPKSLSWLVWNILDKSSTASEICLDLTFFESGLDRQVRRMSGQNILGWWVVKQK